MQIRNIILTLLLMPLSMFAQNLGPNQGDYLEISSVTGASTVNNLMNKLWLYRSQNGNDWYSARFHEGISVDFSFLTPHVNTKTWWERDPNANIQSWGNGASTYLTINQGNVGIGTATPNTKLAVNGKIRAHEIKVEIANWPDYVFAKDYQLPTLLETEKYIKTRGRLPGIPSVEDVKVNGVDLGDMNSKLLQKIEELTLHLIEKEKELNNQKQLLLEQQKSLIKQQRQIDLIEQKLK